MSTGRVTLPSSLFLVVLMHVALANGVLYFCVFPATLRPGADFSVSVTLKPITIPVILQVSVIDNSTGTVLVTKSVTVALGRTASTSLVNLPIPYELKAQEYLVKVSGSGGLTFINSSIVSVHQKTLSIFVQTDKALYKPGQKVLFRAVAIYPNMKPYKDIMNVVIYDKDRNRIAQWLKVKNDKGVFTGELALSTQTPLGTWTIEVTAGVDSAEKTFEVSEYVLPKFEVDVILPSFYLLYVNKQNLQPSLAISVVAKYTYGKPVKGVAKLTARVLPLWEVTPDVHYTWTKTINLVDGEALLEITPEELSWIAPDELKNSISGDTPAWTQLNFREVGVTAEVTESVTGVVLSSSSTVRCYSEKYDFDFLEITPDNFKPGLRFTGYLQLKQKDGSPPLLSDIQLPSGKFRELEISVNPAWSSEPNCIFGTVYGVKAFLTASGFVRFDIDISDTCGLVLEVSFHDFSTNTTLSTSKRIDPFESKADLGIQVSLLKTDAFVKPGDQVSFNVKTTQPIPVFSYVIMSKGSIVIAKTVANINTKIYTLTLNVDQQLAQKLAPSARLVVWCVAGKLEIISDSIEFNVEGAFINNVFLAFDKDKVEPGDKVELEINGSPGSEAYLLAVDQSVLLLKGGNDIVQDQVIKDLSNYEGQSNAGRRWNMPICRRCFWPFIPSGKDSTEIFENAFLIFLTDGYVHRKEVEIIWQVDQEPNGHSVLMRLEESSKPSLSSQEVTKPTRTLFPETWIWTNYTIGPKGVGIYEVTTPDTITSWVASAFAVHDKDGLGVAPTTTNLTVFRSFFVSMTLPYSVVRGEEFALRATVFNYLETDLTVLVTLKASALFNVRLQKQIIENKNINKTIKVPKNDAATVYFMIIPKRVGQIPIEVLANAGQAGDGERRTVIVVPEGVEQRYSTSVLIDNSKYASPYSTSFDVTLPSENLVPDSAVIQVVVLGDILGASLNGLDKLIQMPYGCGEQLMLNLAPNVFILQYLRSTNSLTTEIETKCKSYMQSGYQSELTFQRRDGSFSAFGNNDPAGSIWLSAFVGLVFHQAKNDIAVEEWKIAQTLHWIIGQQNENGSFTEPPNGRVIHTDMQGGSSKGTPLTAYVVIALTENLKNSAVNQTLVQASISKAVKYLESQLISLNDPYSLCIVSYVLVLVKSSKATAALLKRDTFLIAEDGLSHWEKVDLPSPVKPGPFTPPYEQSAAINIEMTAYALLTYVIQKDVEGALPVAQWLLAQRNPNGGFVSTQDTVMALQALSSFAALIYKRPTAYNLKVNAKISKETHAFAPITAKNMLILQIWEPSAKSGSVEITADGLGIALVQLNVKYNVYQLPYSNGLSLTVKTEAKDSGATVIVNTCTNWLRKDQKSGMALEIIQLLSGYEFVSVVEVGDSKGRMKKVETDPKAVSIYYDNLDNTPTCIAVTMTRTVYIENLKNATIKVVEYYNPNNYVIVTYGVKLPICLDCLGVLI